MLAELVTDVLAGPGGEVPGYLRPLADGLVSMRRPQSGVVWLRRSAIACETLQGLAHGRIPCSHAAVDAVGTSRAVEYLRCLLVRYGVLPPRDWRLADFQRWAVTKLGAVDDAEHRQLLERFLRWYLLRHLRSGGTAATPVGHGPYQRAKQRLTVAAIFLAWLASRGHQLGECTQHDLDSWFAAGPSTRQHAFTFLSWARRPRILRGVELPVIHTEAASPLPVPAVRLAAIRRLLLDDALALEDRIVGCLVVLYEPVATLLRHHLCNRSNMTTAANPASPWLFPGQLAGEPATVGSSSSLAGWAFRPGRAGWPHGMSLSARHHPPSSPTRWASPRTRPPATRFSRARTGPPTLAAAHLSPHPNTTGYQFFGRWAHICWQRDAGRRPGHIKARAESRGM